LAYTTLADDRNLADPKESVFLDIQPSFPILKALFLFQPLTSTLEASHEKPSQNVQAVLLTGRFSFCREIINPMLKKPNPS
jgi:hypothetical protein